MKSTNIDLLTILRNRFEQHMHRHQKIDWQEIEKKIVSNKKLYATIEQMEITGGEPDVIAPFHANEPIVIIDCAAESPAGRRSLCYDEKAWQERKENKPSGNAIAMAEKMGIQMLSENDYRCLQSYGDFDLKTSSWLLTPPSIRNLGGSIFGDKRYNQVFIYHNGAQSYYAARGFRGKVIL